VDVALTRPGSPQPLRQAERARRHRLTRRVERRDRVRRPAPRGDQCLCRRNLDYAKKVLVGEGLAVDEAQLQ